jgi:serine/threonine protein kinase
MDSNNKAIAAADENKNYEIIKELGANHSAGRVTYLASDLRNDRLVVIKKFQFAVANSSWDGYKAIEREVAILKQLNHPNIPRYLSNFQTENSIYLVQKYIEARNLEQLIADRQLYSIEQVKDIISKLLEILIYLQTGFDTPVLHRDIKPANILLDSDYQPYLIDFGGSKISLCEGGSTVTGTLGFMAPEQKYGKYSNSTDLYGLGLTLVCWLLRKNPIDMYDLIDHNNRVLGLPDLLSNFSNSTIGWLQKTIEPSPTDRYPNATVALNNFKTIDCEKHIVKQESQNISNEIELYLTVDRAKGLLQKFFNLSKISPSIPVVNNWQIDDDIDDRWSVYQSLTFNTSNYLTVSEQLKLGDWLSLPISTESTQEVVLEIAIDCSKIEAGIYNRKIYGVDSQGNILLAVLLKVDAPARISILLQALWRRIKIGELWNNRNLKYVKALAPIVQIPMLLMPAFITPINYIPLLLAVIYISEVVFFIKVAMVVFEHYDLYRLQNSAVFFTINLLIRYLFKSLTGYNLLVSLPLTLLLVGSFVVINEDSLVNKSKTIFYTAIFTGIAYSLIPIISSAWMLPIFGLVSIPICVAVLCQIRVDLLISKLATSRNNNGLRTR